MPKCIERRGRARAILLALACLAASTAVPTFAQEQKPKDRPASVAALCARLGVGQDATIADIGAGKGRDTWVFAEIVGTSGKVYAEEVTEGLVKSLKEEIEKRELKQVEAVRGGNDDPKLPADSVDMAYMRYVYHHFAKPREMLRGLWRALKPGGYLVVVDRNRGTLHDWVPREQRSRKHFWLAETTVVREAREEGFEFVACAEECCEIAEPFVLIFQRPKDVKQPTGDPDAFLPLADEDGYRRLLPLGKPYQRPVFIALGESRRWIGPILQRSASPGLEIVLEEWATQKKERPPLPAGVSLPSVLPQDGDPKLDEEPIDVVFFLDSYHLLFHGRTLLSALHKRLAPSGCFYVMDRTTPEPLSRREASHRRKIDPETVKREMAEAGFVLWDQGPSPAADRFLLVFGKTRPAEIRPESDPLYGGPQIDSPPGDWLQANSWRLRGLRTAAGKFVPLAPQAGQKPAEKVGTPADGTETWRLPDAELLLSFSKQGEGFVLQKADAAR